MPIPSSSRGRIFENVASLLGARITSAGRTEEENREVGGSPVSKHLTGDAIDVGADSPKTAVAVLTLLSDRGGFTTKGTAPHYHFEASTDQIFARLAALAVLGLFGVSLIAGKD